MNTETFQVNIIKKLISNLKFATTNGKWQMDGKWGQAIATPSK